MTNPQEQTSLFEKSAFVSSIPNFRNNRLFTYLTIISADMTAMLLAGLLAIVVRQFFSGHLDMADYLPFLGVLPIFVLIFGLAGLYPGVALNPVDELRRLFHAITASYLIIIAGTFLVKMGPNYSRLVFLGAWLSSVLLVILARNLVRSSLANKPWWGIPIVIFGAGHTGTMLLNILLKNPHHGFKPAVVLDDDPAKHRPGDGNGMPPVLGSLDLAPWVSKQFQLHYALVAMPSVPSRQLSRILHKHAHQFPHFLLIPDLFGLTSLWVTAKDFGGVLGLEIQQNLIRRTPRVMKRMVDLMLVTTGGICILPLLTLIALAVKFTSAGPIFYSQKRVGKRGRFFQAWKFRSMIPNADQVLHEYLAQHPELLEEWNKDHKLKNDPRITGIGKLIRKTSLDELPQLWNVLVGEMSLVGPRPIVEKEIPKYGDGIDLYFKVHPGITGLWQVSGRNNTSYETRVDFDEYYVRNWSVWLDLYILGRTIKTVIRAEGAY